MHENVKEAKILLAAVVILALIVFAGCIYWLLKSRGKICKSKDGGNAAESEFEHRAHEVANDSTAKKNKNGGKAFHVS